MLVLAAAAGVLAAAATVVRHNSARAAATVGAVAASSAPRPSHTPAPTKDIAGYGSLREGGVLRGTVPLVITLRPGVPGPVSFSLAGPRPRPYTREDDKAPYTFPGNGPRWDTTAVVNGNWTLTISVGADGVQQRIHFAVDNPGR